MKIEQNMMQFAESGGDTGYIDLARSLTAVNGKSITQTTRRKGKYVPNTFIIRIRALSGDVIVFTLNNGYPTRNAVVLAGHARDEMLKSAGISRSNLETYQKELRILMENGGGLNHQYTPSATDKGLPAAKGGWGTDVYDYTHLTFADPDGTDIDATATRPLIMLGEQSADRDDWDTDAGVFVVDNWLKWRHSLTPAATADDIAENAFSWVIQQGGTASGIIDQIDDEADEKPYDLTNFHSKTISTVVGTGVGNPTSALISAPLGLLKVVCPDSATWEIEVVGVAEM